MPKMQRLIALVLCATVSGLGLSSFEASVAEPSTYENSLILVPIYVEYLNASSDEFARQAESLKTDIPSAPYTKIGFGAFLTTQFPDIPLDQPITEGDLSGDVAKIDRMVDRAHANGLITHVAFISGFFHNQNPLRYSAIRQDVRNAQWFADGLIADPSQLTDPNTVPQSAWVTPSRYAQPLRTRIEEGIRILGRHVAARMKQFPDVLLTASGDGEVEFTFERNFGANATQPPQSKSIIYTDYSPSMVQEFRDWIRNGRYDGDLTPDTDDDGDGHTFNRDFGQSFTTWKLRYFDSSGPIPYFRYINLPEKLPSSGPYAVTGGFDAPRAEKANDPFWAAWVEFRKTVIKNWVRDFSTWITTSPDPDTRFQVPPSHFYTHQIPADFIFGKRDDPRLKTSASYVETAIIDPLASTGVTIFNVWDGKKAHKTATPALFSSLFMTSKNWGLLEYNPSIPYTNSLPPDRDPKYYATELRTLWNFRPHLIAPALWSDDPIYRGASIKGSVYARALRDFVRAVGKVPWSSWRDTLR
jgi:hypothetical protein